MSENSENHHNNGVTIPDNNDPTLFTPAVIIRSIGNGSGPFTIDVYERPGQYGKADAKVQTELDPGETFEYYDYAGKVKLRLTVQIIVPD
jgi:hypothetical protein